MTDNSFKKLEELIRYTRQYGGKEYQVIAKQSHVFGNSHIESVRTYSPQGTINSNALRGTSAIPFLINRGSFETFGQMFLKFNVTVKDNPAQIAPVVNWFQKIELKENTGNQVIRTWFADTINYTLVSALNTNKLKALSPMLGFDSRDDTLLGVTQAYPANTSVDFFLPLPSNVLNDIGAYWAGAQSDLIIYLYPDSSGVVVSGTGTVDLNSIQMLLDTAINDERVSTLKEESKYNVQEGVFLEPQQQAVQTITINPSLTNTTPIRFDLSGLVGKCSHLLVMCRLAGQNSNVNFTNDNMYSFGEESGATVDIVDSGNVSLYGNGSPVSLKYLQSYTVSTENCDNDILRLQKYYAIPFTSSIPQSYAGKMNGFWQFHTQSKNYLIIQPRVMTPEIQTIAHVDGTGAALAPGDGTFRFQLGKEMTVGLPYNATAAQMKAAVDALDFCKRRNLTVTFSGAFNSGTSITATFTCPETNGCQQHLLYIVPNNLNNAGTEVISNTTCTQRGFAGLLPGANNYDIFVYAFMYKRCSYFNGRFRVEDV